MSESAGNHAGGGDPPKLEYAPPPESGRAAFLTDYVRPFTCPHCGNVAHVRASLVGQSMICWGCEAPVTITEPAPIRFDGEADEASRVRLQRLRCTFCGYPLAGLPENTCPECGHRFDLAAMTPKNRRPSMSVEAAALIGLLALLMLSCLFFSR